MQTKAKKLNFTGKDIYIGIDVHLKSWVITLVIDGVFFKTFSQNPTALELSNYLKTNFSVYEAGFSGYSTHRELEKYGIANIVVNPADVPTTDKDKSQKEDKRDSRKLAKSLSNGELEGIYILSKDYEELRSLVRYRKTLTKEIGRHKNRVKSTLKFFGIAIPKEYAQASKYWSAVFSKWLKTITTSTDNGTVVLQDTLEIVEYLRSKLLKVNRQFRELAIRSKYSSKINLLQSVPGIGLISALTFISELEKIERFKSLDKLC